MSEGRPTPQAPLNGNIKTPVTSRTPVAIVPPAADVLAELDALAESLRGYFVVQVVVDDEGHRRTSIYRSAGAAEKAVRRARERGRTAHVSLCQLLPVGVVSSLGGGRR